MKILIASHGNFASGLKSAIKIIAGDNDIDCIDAYIDGSDFKDKLNKYIQNNNEICVLTDLFGGSVNQEAMKYINDKKIYLITGVNLSLALEIVLANKYEGLNSEKINHIVDSAKQQIMYINHSFITDLKDDFE